MEPAWKLRRQRLGAANGRLRRPRFSIYSKVCLGSASLHPSICQANAPAAEISNRLILERLCHRQAHYTPHRIRGIRVISGFLSCSGLEPAWKLRRQRIGAATGRLRRPRFPAYSKICLGSASLHPSICQANAPASDFSNRLLLARLGHKQAHYTPPRIRGIRVISGLFCCHETQ